MAKTTMYMAKIDTVDFNKWKEAKSEFNGRLMFQLWIDHLSIPKNFNAFLRKVEDDERERSEGALTKSKLTKLNKENWKNFLALCIKNEMCGNDMINILVKHFNKHGYCVETKIKV
jgi:hypothetical protein